MELIPPNSRDCLVVHCSEPAAALWGIHHVCSFHFTALNAGEPFDYESMDQWPGPILMGADLPGEVMQVQLSQRSDGVKTAVFVTGRDGLEDSRVRLRVSLEHARALVSLLEYDAERADAGGEGAV